MSYRSFALYQRANEQPIAQLLFWKKAGMSDEQMSKWGIAQSSGELCSRLLIYTYRYYMIPLTSFVVQTIY